MNENQNYDIRKLSVGGWSSSQISVQSYGRWLQFTDPVSNNVINSTLPINYSKKYKPPKIYKKNKENDSDSSLDNYIFNAKSQINQPQKVIVPQIELSPERTVLKANQNFNLKTRQNTNNNFHSKIIPDKSNQNQIQVHDFVFDDSDIPQEIHKNKIKATSTQFSRKSKRDKNKSELIRKPRKTYLNEFNDDSNMIIYGYRPSSKSVKKYI